MDLADLNPKSMQSIEQTVKAYSTQQLNVMKSNFC